MLNKELIALTSVLSLVASPAFAQGDVDAPESAADEIVCRMVTEIGTKIPGRICRTVEQWQIIEQDNEDAIRQSRNGRYSSCSGLAKC